MAFSLFNALLFLQVALISGDDACSEPTSLLQAQALKDGHVPPFHGTANETKRKYFRVLKGPPADMYPYDAMSCPGEQTVTTKHMTSALYDEIVQKIQALYKGLDPNCDAETCAPAEWAGCVLRLAGHDFMDYNPQTKMGGSDGCLAFSDPDNGGLAECLYTGAEFGISVADVYEHYCTEVSLADFLVIAANAVIEITRQKVLDEDPSLPSIHLKDIFKWGRTTAKKCPEAYGRMPNPEESCKDVDKVFVQNMGLSWKRAAALMGVHTLGRCRIENSGYDGWWSNVWNSGAFNNNYYIAIGAKGWIRERNVAGNPNKNQWQLGDQEAKKQGKRGKQMMLNTDLCLAYTNNRKGTVDLNAATAKQYGCRCAWMGPREASKGWHKYNKNRFCGTQYVPDDFSQGWTKERQLCCNGRTDPGGRRTDCGNPANPKGKAVNAVKEFMKDEGSWLRTFKLAWETATNNGFEGKLKPL